MPDVHMVPVATAATTFEAQVIAARLGSEGLLWELRGNVGGPFALGPIEVLVVADDEPVARELLLSDDVESAFDDYDQVNDGAHRPGVDIWILVLAIGLSVAFTLARLIALG